MPDVKQGTHVESGKQAKARVAEAVGSSVHELGLPFVSGPRCAPHVAAVGMCGLMMVG